jgi:hypothetical protein
MAEANRRQAVDPKVYQRKTEYVEDVDYGAEISKITEPIGLELANREAQKDKIQKDYESVEEQLQNFEFDTESDNSSLVLDLVNKAKAANYENNQLVINGKIPPIDGQKRQARISNQMKEAGKANKTWNENLEKKSKRATDLISAPSEIAATSAINQFSNTKGLQSYVDDTGNIWTYRADTRKEIEDPNNPGQMIKNPDFNKTPDFKTQPGKFIAYSRINEQMQYESNRANFDVGAIIGAKNKELGKFITSMGLTTTVDGVTGRSVLTKEALSAINSEPKLKKLWDTYKENTSNTLTYDNEAVANILALNEGYQIVLSQEDFDELKKTDPELRDDQMILMNTLESPPTFTFKGGQDVATNAAKDVVKNQIDVDMGFVEKQSSTQFPPADGTKGVKEKEDRAVSFDIAYDVTSGGKSSAAAIETIKANNDTVSNIYSDPTSDEFVIQFTDGSRKKIKKSEKEIIKDGKKKIVYDAKATAENLMAAVTPGGDVVSARQAREEYTGDDKPFSDDFNTDKDERPASNSGTGFMNTTTTVNGKIVPVTIADAFAKITNIDNDSAGAYDILFKGLALEEGTENLLSNISVAPTSRGTGTDDVLTVSGLPPEVMALIDRNHPSLKGDVDGQKGEDFIEIDLENLDNSGNDSGLKYIIDKILQASANQYNGITPNSGGTGTGVGGKYNNKK